MGKEAACNARDTGLTPGLGSFPGEGNDKPLEDCCWRIPWAAWWATVHGVIKSWTRLSTNELRRTLRPADVPQNSGLVVWCRAGLTAAEKWSSGPSESPSLYINRQAGGGVRGGDHFFWPPGQCYPGEQDNSALLISHLWYRSSLLPRSLSPQHVIHTAARILFLRTALP